MPSIDPKAPITPEPHGEADAPPTEANPGDVKDFEDALSQNPQNPRQSGLFENFTVDSSKPRSIFENFTVAPRTPGSPATDEGIDLDNYQPEQPDVPTPQEKKSSFWDSFRSEINRGVDSLKEFLAKPETAKFVRAANIVFAGAMVAAAGVLFATGVGAPAGIAALALAGGSGLVMQLPAVHDKLEAGVVALMAPVLGQENAEKLGPLVTQGLISGLMIAIVASGGQAGSAQGALDAAIGVFNSMKDAFNGIAQVYEAGGPLLEMLGVNVDSQALKDMAAVFGSMAALMPDLSKFTEGIGVSLKDFLANPDMDAFKKFLSTAKDVPESLSKLIDSDFLKGLGALLDGGEKFFTEFESKDLLNNLTGLLQLLDQGAKLAKA
jgi:hypothetical protein